MVYEVSGVRMPLDAGLPEGADLIRASAARALGISPDCISDVSLLKRSVDARKNRVSFIATLAVTVNDGRVCADDFELAKGVRVKEHVPYEPLDIPHVALPEGEPRPLVVGTGPAGLFAALYLARAGLRPIVIERGGPVQERLAAVQAFDKGAVLDPRNNIQFGEGGAGTFSDGKLTTGTKSPLARHVLHWFAQAGAPDEILWQAKPHIGTDKLVEIVSTMRRQIQQAGGDVLFYTKLDGVEFDEDGALCGVRVKVDAGAGADADSASKVSAWLRTEMLRQAEDGSALCASPTSALPAFSGCRIAETFDAESTSAASDASDSSPIYVEFPCKQLVLACGHSARDTFRMLQRAGLPMQPKPFSVGVRIEHLQKDIDRAQYGSAAGHPALGAADYKLVVHLPDGRSVYTFCMCPGGKVVAAASEEYGVAVNGMSTFARDGRNANAALLVGVTPDDFAGSDPLAGMVFQRRLEQAAFGEAHEMGGNAWDAPVQTVGDFLSERAGNPSKKVQPTYERGVVWCDLREVLPEFVIQAFEQAIPLLDRKLKGFADPEAVMTGVETRSSSPVRIVRDDESLQAVPGIYPCGEGPGYAGGIMSAAVDGLRIAQKIVESAAEAPASSPSAWLRTEMLRQAEDGSALCASPTSALPAFSGCRIAEGEDAGASAGDAPSGASATGTSAGDTPSSASPDDAAFNQVVRELKAGRPALFPTDTVYGLGVSVRHAGTPQALFDLKERAADKPVAWLVGDRADLQRYGTDLSPETLQLAQREWPGACTIIVKASAQVPPQFCSQAGTIGLRMPNDERVLQLIRAIGSPIATTSANVSGAYAPAHLQDVDERIRSRVSAELPDSAAASGTASTVIDCSSGHPVVLRP